jgi:hypothetical protein
MTGTTLKILAFGFMLVDHIGYFLFPDLMLLRIIGRLSFPLFAWLLVEGFEHSRDWRLYGLRLFLLALVSQPIYYLASGLTNLNILFSLTLGLLLLRLTQINTYCQILVYSIVALLLPFSDRFPFEYGSYGLMLILLMALKAPFGVNVLAWLVLHIIITQIAWDIQFFAFFALFLLWFYNGDRGRKIPKYLFYSFYPVHLLIFYFIKTV